MKHHCAQDAVGIEDHDRGSKSEVVDEKGGAEVRDGDVSSGSRAPADDVAGSELKRERVLVKATLGCRSAEGRSLVWLRCAGRFGVRT